MMTQRTLSFASLAVLLLAFTGPAAAQSLPAPAPAARATLAALPAIDAAALEAGIRTLSSDAFEGRLPGTVGEERTVQWLVEQFTGMGLQPGNTDGTYLQKVPLAGITPSPAEPLTFTRAGTATSLRWREDYVAFTSRVVDEVAISGTDVLFVGYGVQAPEFAWDDYKRADVTGKLLVMLVNDPPVTNPRDLSKLDDAVFGGRAMTYYGRWTYKYEIGAQLGAAGVLIVHETEPAGYPWGVVKGFSDERFTLRTPDRNMGQLPIEGWLSLDAARALFARAGQDFDALKQRAATRAFAPVPLGTTAGVRIANRLREVDSTNVIARLDGADAQRRGEYVVYTAHWDHLGVGEAVNGDRIYNGAVDNATGTAGLVEIARAFTKLAQRPPRSIVFLAVTAEEQGLRGAQYYTEHPVYPLEKTLANVNMDALNVYGRTTDFTVVGYGASDLDDLARELAAEQGRTLRSDPEPQRGGYYRSDHFNFAKAGVPAFYGKGGDTFVDKPDGYATRVRDEYLAVRYHKPQDEVLPTWDLSGLREDLTLLFGLGVRVAGAETWPEWKPGNEFRARREKSLSGTR
jgi:Zn-dependent M28 family amino/carboxypeptidase